MVMLNIETDDEQLSKTKGFVDKTYTSHGACVNGGFTGEPPEFVFTEQLGLTYIPFYTIVNSEGRIVYNGSYSDSLFDIAEKIAKQDKETAAKKAAK
mmetsp:Transcript_3925/g.7540  ORF Transcript_3925/g.7540 Transcript_3925/m.7540 type:complete len:97 (+) Transcript_3925:236-526(+)